MKFEKEIKNKEILLCFFYRAFIDFWVGKEKLLKQAP